MAEPYIDQIYMYAGNFPPRGWALRQGQLLAISTSTALFSLSGTTYGDNGQTTFGLPDMHERSAVGVRQDLNATLTGPIAIPAAAIATTQAAPATTTVLGTVAIHNPYIGINFFIATEGIFPSWN